MIKKGFSNPPPPEKKLFLNQFYFLNVGNSIKREENIKYLKKLI